MTAPLEARCKPGPRFRGGDEIGWGIICSVRTPNAGRGSQSTHGWDPGRCVQPLEDVAYSLMPSDRRSRVSPFVAQFAELQENRLLVRIVG